MEINYEALGARIRKIRKQKHMTQEYVAEKVEISVSHMSNIENASKKLSLKLLVSIADILEVTVDELLMDSYPVEKRQDIFYKENKNVGERRRVWASCQVDGFTDIAGGHSFRNSKGDRLRFKAMHKVYDFNKRFGYQMCVGCGRCDDNCPQYISFSTTIDKINDFLKEDE